MATGRTRGVVAVLAGGALPLVLGLLIGTADTAAADNGPYDCTDTNRGTSLCQNTHSLGPVGWAVVIGLVLVVILGLGWMMRIRQRRRARLARMGRRGWRRLFGRRRVDRY
jgi:hypothetical protein